ncbi:spherulin-1B [Mollisia scopiformis]|uniref:Spherulin-1B n=1 Tax=Mollisia scopiformis TaxID=149040 RepID=A0A132B5D2_MOLSC|nr:spherulin-1B [Mollisia scopiformis]KUJ07612.1 spherulin-1B [Mollisia scopiformis]
MITSTLSATPSAVNNQQSSSVAPSTCTSAAPNPTLFQELVLAPNAAARIALLTDDEFVFDFADPCKTTSKQGVTAGLGGETVRADHATFPALVGSGGSVTMGFLKGCGFNTPHVHPRSSELNVVVEGRLFASVTAENGARHMNHTLEKYQMTVFPQGAIHTEFNPDCTPAVFVASFSNEDPGVGQIAQEYFGLEDEIVEATVGGEITVDGADIDIFRNKLPANVVIGVESCLAKCGISKR